MAARVLRRQCFTACWLLLGGMAWFLPLILFIHSRMTNHLPSNYYSTSGNNRNGYNRHTDDFGWGSYFGSNNDDDDIRWKNYRDNNCSWLFGCEYKAHAQPEAPRWWIGSEESSESSSPSLQVALGLVYAGSSVMFAGILCFGYQTALIVRFEQYQSLDSLQPILLVFMLFSAITMVMISCSGGMVATSGREFLRNGWFGQIGVLLYVTAFFWIVFSFVFMLVISTQLSQFCFYQSDSIDNYQLYPSEPTDARERSVSPSKKSAVSGRNKTTTTTPAVNPSSPRRVGNAALKSLHQRRWEESLQAKMTKSRTSPVHRTPRETV